MAFLKNNKKKSPKKNKAKKNRSQQQVATRHDSNHKQHRNASDVNNRRNRRNIAEQSNAYPEDDKIMKYRKPVNTNIGLFIGAGVLIYIIIIIVISLGNTHVSPYEVKEGSLATNYTYRGIALRSEEIVHADHVGYINYYARETERVAKGDLIYTIDETGKLNDFLNNNETGESVLSDRELSELRSDIVNFIHGFSPEDFSSVYSFKYMLKGTVVKLANSTLMQSIDTLNAENNSNSIINFCNSTSTGVVTYWIDGLEQVTPDMINKDDFDESKYEKTPLLSVDIITVGDPAYKLLTNEDWSIVFPVENSVADDLLEEQYVKVKFLKNQYESWGQVSITNGSDNAKYAVLTFNNSMSTFALDRFIDIELILHDEVGLKIPNSSITEKEFFLIPEEFTIDADDDKRGVCIEKYSDTGELYTEVISLSVYNHDTENKEYYMDASNIGIGTNLIKPEGQEKFTVSRRGTLTGVYNMNKGYAEFRRINILYQNEEYAIVRPNVQFGLNVYDYIVLNADSVKEDQFIY